MHFHVGSQLARVDESLLAVERLARVLRAARGARLEPRVLDLGGGLGIRHNRDEHVPSVADFVRPLVGSCERWPERVQLDPRAGRSLVGRAGVTLYRVGSVKESGGVTYAAIDGGMSDNPRPQLYGARYEALLANRAEELPSGVYRVAGKHCESGDVLIEAAELPQPRPGDVLAVPATGAYTLAMGSTYNGVPRPAVVLVADGEARAHPRSGDRGRSSTLRTAMRLARVPGVVLVAVAAAMWGTDPIIRKTMSGTTSATTIVFGEHVILVAADAAAPLPRAARRLPRRLRYVAAAVVIGAGASAVATILFTDALFGHSRLHHARRDPEGAAARRRRRAPRCCSPSGRGRASGWFLLPALAGFWLVNQPHPFEPSASGVVVIVEATAAAVLWALGTVLGRYMSREMEFQHILCCASSSV